MSAVSASTTASTISVMPVKRQMATVVAKGRQRMTTAMAMDSAALSAGQPQP